MARKIVCDICSRDTDDTDYVLPSIDEIQVRGGNPETALLTMSIKRVPRIYNLCSICANEISSFVYQLEVKAKMPG